MEQEKNKGVWSVGRLVIGIISMVLFLIVMLQSCAAGVANTLVANDAVSGSIGFLVSLCLLAGGIVGVSTRNSRNTGGPIACVIIYAIGALMAISQGKTYADLPFWGFVSFAFGVVFLICVIKTKKI